MIFIFLVMIFPFLVVEVPLFIYLLLLLLLFFFVKPSFAVLNILSFSLFIKLLLSLVHFLMLY